jgi:hypothetical protein
MPNDTASFLSRCASWALRSMAGTAWMCPEASLFLCPSYVEDDDESTTASPQRGMSDAGPQASVGR